MLSSPCSFSGLVKSTLLFGWFLSLPQGIASSLPGAPIGEEFRVNTDTLGAQNDPTVAMSALGDFIIAWFGAVQPGTGKGNSVYAQRYSAAGVPQGGQVNLDGSSGAEWAPDTVMLPDGVFSVAWIQARPPKAPDFRQKISVGIYDLAGVQTGGLMIDPGPDGWVMYMDPSVASNNRGEFVAVWLDDNHGTISGQRYDAAGPVGEPFQINTMAVYAYPYPDVAMDAEGKFMVVWGSQARLYAADGTPLTGEFRIDPLASGWSASPAIAAAPRGEYVVVWQGDRQDGNGLDIFARRFDATGGALGQAFRVHEQAAGHQRDPAIAMDASGDYVVTWTGEAADGSGDIHARRYQSSDMPLGGEFQVNAYSAGVQENSGVAMDADGDFIVVWQSQGQDGSDWGVYARRFSGSEDVNLRVRLTSPNSEPVPAGGVLTYRARVDNLHAVTYPTGHDAVDQAIGAATGIAIRNTPPAGATFISARGGGWACEPAVGLLACQLESPLLAGESSSLVLRYSAPPQGGGLVDRVRVSASTYDSHPGNNSDQVVRLGIDSLPDSFDFIDKTRLKPNTVTYSSRLILNGFDGPLPISVSNGQYSIDGGAWMRDDGMIQPGNQVQLRTTTPAEYASAKTVLFTAGATSDPWTVRTEDPYPDTFDFTDASAVVPDTLTYSQKLILGGFDIPVAVAVVNGKYRINEGGWSDLPGQVVSGDQVQLRTTSAPTLATAKTVTFTAGTVSDTWTITTADPTPDPFQFRDVTGANPGVEVQSAGMRPAGFDTPTPVTIAGGQYRVDEGEWTDAPGILSPGGSVRLRTTSAATFTTLVAVTFTAGGIADNWKVWTRAGDATPHPFEFAGKIVSKLDTLVFSNAVTPAGYEVPIPVSISGGQYRVIHEGNEGAWTEANGSMEPGDQVQVRVRSASSPGVTKQATFTAGGVSATFSVTTSL